MPTFASSTHYLPGQFARIEDRKAKHGALSRFVRQRGGWITSVPGDRTVTVETLPGSTLPADLRALGYDPVPDGTGERILPAPIVERFTAGPGGELAPLTPGSTRPVVETRTHAGITAVERWTFTMGNK